MKIRTRALTLTAAAALGVLVTAHHVPVPLSHVVGSEILTEVVYHTASERFGVPPYFAGSAEVEHDEPVAVNDGDTIYVKHAGLAETIVLETADFVDIGNTEIGEVLGVISSKSQLVDAFETNSYTILRGTQGGADASIALEDVVGNVLEQLTFDTHTMVRGTEDLDLVVSVPLEDEHAPRLDHHPLGGHRYLVLVSTTDGEFSFRGTTIPVGLDPVLQAGVRAAFQGALPGFRGLLDHGGDALATLSGGLLSSAFAGSYPDKLYFTYLVFADGSLDVEFVSNRFTVDFQ